MNSTLTRKEMEITELIVLGATKKDIANVLHKSYGTVDAQLKNIYSKLDISKQSDLVRWWFMQSFKISKEELTGMIKAPAFLSMVVFMAIVLHSLMSDGKMMRTRTTRTAQSRTVRASKGGGRKGNDYKMEV